MPKDYKRRRRPVPAPGWVWMLCGLAIGLSASLLIYLNEGRENGREASPRAAAGNKETVEEVKEKPARRFDFYELLPKFEVIIPEQERDVRPDIKATAVETPGSYVLQAGSFQNFEDADRMRATLALLGIRSRIQRVSIDQDTWHRVRIGPIDELDELNRVREQLRGAEIEVLMIRVGG